MGSDVVVSSLHRIDDYHWDPLSRLYRNQSICSIMNSHHYPHGCRQADKEATACISLIISRLISESVFLSTFVLIGTEHSTCYMAPWAVRIVLMPLSVMENRSTRDMTSWRWICTVTLLFKVPHSVLFCPFLPSSPFVLLQLVPLTFDSSFFMLTEHFYWKASLLMLCYPSPH